jgi:hypothetical protein
MLLAAGLGRLIRDLQEMSQSEPSLGQMAMFAALALFMASCGIYQIRTKRVIFVGGDRYRGVSARAYGVVLVVVGCLPLLALGYAWLTHRDVPPPRVAAARDLPSGGIRQDQRQEIDDEALQTPDAERPAPLTLGRPAMPLPPIQYDDAEVQRTAMAGDDHRDDIVEDRAPAGGLLVGVRLSRDLARGERLVGVQPIYQVGEVYELGRPLGQMDATVSQLLAEPGFVVGRVDVRGGFSVDAIRLVYFHIEQDGLGQDGQYESPWVGGEGGRESSLGAGGDFVVGMCGVADRELRSLGLLYADQFARRLGACSTSLPRWTAAEATTVEILPLEDEVVLRDSAPEGGALVGLRVGQGHDFGGAVSAIQPIYQVGDQYHVGRWCGQASGAAHVLLAEPGYVVGRINARAGLVLDALQLHFVRVRDDRLDEDDAYDSEWIGGSGGRPADLPEASRLIVGISGSADSSVNALVYEAVVSETTEPQLPAEPRRTDEMRTWSSADGKFTVEARLVEVLDGQPVLRNADGRRLRVPLEKLSEADRQYVAQWRELHGQKSQP